MTGKKDAGSDRRSDQGRTRGAPEAVKTPRVFDYLSGMPHFSFVSEEERKAVSEKAAYESYPEGHVYAVQGQTEIQDIFVVVKGSLSLYDGGGDDKRLIGHIKPGEVFGGISILLNGGVSLRTVVVDRDCSGIAIPRGIFQDLCTRSKVFYEYFLENFSSHIFDPALTNIIETGQTRHFLARVDPFSFLPAEEIDPIVSQLSMVHYPKGAVLFVQGRSRVGYLYILQKGSAERYYEEGRKKTMSGMLGEGDAYGGISMLLNDGISVRTLQVTEDSYFYLLPKQQFLDICARNEAFSEYFTDIFGKRMLERSYARIVANTAHPKEEGSLFFNRLVTDIYAQNPAFCGMDASIRDTACIMRGRHIGSVFIQDEKGRCVGVVTERDLTEKVIAEGIDPAPAGVRGHVVPVRAIPGQALVFEALMVMMQENIRHLAVTGADDAVIGVLSSRDLLAAQGHSPLLLLREIADAGDMDAIIQRRGKVPEMVRGLIASGVQAKNVTRFITAVSDAILDKLVGYALDTLGAPPARFAFMIMGSEGRREQTLKTDQDNAIVFEDVPASRQAEVTDYFLKFGETVCNLLDQAGYAFCTGGVMAKNPKWCQPLSAWKNDFSSWIHAAEPEDLLQASIFFDFRAGLRRRALVGRPAALTCSIPSRDGPGFFGT